MCTGYLKGDAFFELVIFGFNGYQILEATV